ncbi:MAG: helix-turn-helix transcriptional regulator [Clostridia bacterium]|nr:helix-turn-helix transcriptional regulator [Clostridia bacterium]
MPLSENVKRGSVELLLLTLLQNEDMYGYQLAQELESRSGGRYSLQESSMYPILYRMMDKGLISDKQVLVGKRRTRVYYHLEDKGREYLAQIRMEYLMLCKGILQILEVTDFSQLEEGGDTDDN